MKKLLWVLYFTAIAAMMVVAKDSYAASPKCAGGWIDEGDTVHEVEVKCGEPHRVVTGGARSDESWYFYSLDNGIYTLRFLKGTLREIKFEK